MSKRKTTKKPAAKRIVKAAKQKVARCPGRIVATGARYGSCSTCGEVSNVRIGGRCPVARVQQNPWFSPPALQYVARMNPPPGGPPRECSTCGCEERVGPEGLCSWCHADRSGRPYGSCVDCQGAKDSDSSCACKPPGETGRSRRRMGHNPYSFSEPLPNPAATPAWHAGGGLSYGGEYHPGSGRFHHHRRPSHEFDYGGGRRYDGDWYPGGGHYESNPYSFSEPLPNPAAAWHPGGGLTVGRSYHPGSGRYHHHRRPAHEFDYGGGRRYDGRWYPGGGHYESNPHVRQNHWGAPATVGFMAGAVFAEPIRSMLGAGTAYAEAGRSLAQAHAKRLASETAASANPADDYGRWSFNPHENPGCRAVDRGNALECWYDNPPHDEIEPASPESHPQHAARMGVRGCSAATMGHRGCLNCGWRMFPTGGLAPEARERLEFREGLLAREPRHNVLCQCGWGQLNMLESQIPSHCPVCSAPIGEQGDDRDDDWESNPPVRENASFDYCVNCVKGAHHRCLKGTKTLGGECRCTCQTGRARRHPLTEAYYQDGLRQGADEDHDDTYGEYGQNPPVRENACYGIHFHQDKPFTAPKGLFEAAHGPLSRSRKNPGFSEELDEIEIRGQSVPVTYSQGGRYHHARVADPDEFEQIRTKTLSESKGIKARIGRHTGAAGPRGGQTEIQSYLFDATRYTPQNVARWLEGHKTPVPLMLDVAPVEATSRRLALSAPAAERKRTSRQKVTSKVAARATREAAVAAGKKKPARRTPPADRRCTDVSSGSRCKGWTVKGKTICGLHAGGFMRTAKPAAKKISKKRVG